jgi:hypothetical protein
MRLSTGSAHRQGPGSTTSVRGPQRSGLEHARSTHRVVAIAMTRRARARAPKRSRRWFGRRDRVRGISKAPFEQAGEPKQSCRV